MYRGVVALIVVAACDAGAPAPTPAPARIDWQLGGLGTWHGQVYGGVICRVRVELPAHRVAITDPDGTTVQPLSAASERTLRDLATVVRTEPVVPTSDSCTDRSETLHVDSLVLEGSCPIWQPGAAALIGALSAFCKSPP